MLPFSLVYKLEIRKQRGIETVMINRIFYNEQKISYLQFNGVVASESERETSCPTIPTFSQQLDKILGNDGFQLGLITELLGLPGSGKTQLCLQLCTSIQIPHTLGGLNAEALYVDTNTNFSIHRFKDILKASLLKCYSVLDEYVEFDEREALKKLHHVNAFGLEKFCAFMHLLPKYLSDRPNIKLIVIDSIVFPFKEGITVKQRTGLLFRQMAELQRLAVEKRIAIVLTNEMSTRLGLSGGSVVGAMGDAWAHRCNARLLLSAGEGHRVAALMKSNVAPAAAAGFQITNDGIRDIE